MSKKGFTLIEVLVTISILSIVFTLAIPKIDLDFAYMDKMANEFAMDIRCVQMECMKRPNSNSSICINVSEGCYHIYIKTSIVKTVTFKKRYKINYTNVNMDAIRFTYEGMPINAGTFSILDTKTNEIKKVSIVPTTGRTVIME